MTTISRIEETCAACGKNSKRTELNSTNTIEAMDLDTRPGEMMRSTMGLWVAECPHCGYAAKSLDQPPICGKEFLDTPEYKEFTDAPPKSKLAMRFIKKARISEKAGKCVEAFLDYLHAAWDSDDCRDEVWMTQARLRALEMMDRFSEREMNDDRRILRADLLRKTRQFDRLAREYGNMRLENEFLSKILSFELQLAAKGDAGTYRVDQV